MKARLILPTLILIFGVFILQSHSIGFWTKTVGASTGFVWSILLELTSLWLWSLRSVSTRLIGLLTTFVLLTGPLYEVSSPILKDLQLGNQSVASLDKKIELLEDSIKQDREALKIFLSNSQGRNGWQQKISEAQAGLNDSIKNLQRVQDEKFSLLSATPRLSFQAALVLALQVLSIIVFQCMTVFAVNQLAAGLTPVTPKAQTPPVFPFPIQSFQGVDPGNLETPSNAVLETNPVEIGNRLEPAPQKTPMTEAATLDSLPELPMDGPDLIERIKGGVTGMLAQTKTTQAELSSLLGISKRDLSLLLNFDAAKTERRRPSRNAINMIQKHFSLNGFGVGQ